MSKFEGKFEARKPDYKISAKTMDGKVIKGNIGAAWINESGTISIRLNPFVVISSMSNLQITMFPYDKKEEP